MASIRCHTVPKFYLNYFLPPKASLFWVYDKKDISIRQQPPLNTAVVGDYYLSAPDLKGQKDARMEEYFSIMEGMTKPILDEWIRNPASFHNKDVPIVAIFLSFLFTRAPRAVEAVKEIAQVGLEYCLEEMKKISVDERKLQEHYKKFCASDQAKDIKVSFEEFHDMMVNPTKNCTLEINEKHAIGDSLNVSDTIYHYLTRLNWGIYYIQGNHFFITNDAPLNIFVYEKDGRATFGGGLASPNVEVAFPLSPKTCLWMSKKSVLPSARVHANFVREINRRMVYMAERFVISPYRSNNIQKMVKEFAPFYGKPKTDHDLIKESWQVKHLIENN